MPDFEAITRAVSDLDEETLKGLLADVATDSETAQKALAACQEGLDIVGNRFESGDYFVADLIFAGDIMSGVVESLKPALGSAESGSTGVRMILCTVKGDLHDIGKNIVKSLLEASSIEVIDLGIDVAPNVIVEAAKREKIHIIALSAVLSLGIDSMKQTVEEFAAAGMREDVKIIVGGATITQDSCGFIGADEWAISPQKTVKTCLEWARA